MDPRSIVLVTREIQEQLPDDLKHELDWYINDFSFKPPEQIGPWHDLFYVINKLVGLKLNENMEPINPEVLLEEPWKIKIISIFSTHPEDEIRADVMRRVGEKEKINVR